MLSIATIIIGNSIPDKVLSIIDTNKKNFPLFEVLRFDCDDHYSCPGIQAEFMKLFVLSKRSDIVVCDWDVEFTRNDCCLSGTMFGFRGNIPDMFLTYNNDLIAMSVFDNFANEARNRFMASPGFTSILAGRMYRAGLCTWYPNDAYIHHGTNMGMSNVKLQTSGNGNGYKKLHTANR